MSNSTASSMDYAHCPECTRGAVLGKAHGTNFDDGLFHYFGCLKFSDREDFLAALPNGDQLKIRILAEQTQILRLRQIFEEQGRRTGVGKLFREFQQAIADRFPRPIGHLGSGPVAQQLIHEQFDYVQPHYSPLENEAISNDLKANVICLKKGSTDSEFIPHEDPRILGEFPNQRVPLSLLLENNPNDNPLMWKCEETMIKYFHLPANNMSWVEEALARYYHEDTPDFSSPSCRGPRGSKGSKVRTLLQPQFWRDLQNGDKVDLPPHSRHMRPHCLSINMVHRNDDTIRQNNIAIFMPYLHWETERNMSRAADAVGGSPKSERVPLRNIHEPVETRAPKSALETDIMGQLRPRRKWLSGKLLFLAAALYEAMDSYTDQKLMEMNLTSRSPLHLRRTLHQSFHWTLRNTRTRARDQIVYRETSPWPHEIHHGCTISSCVRCTENIKMIPRLVMVDQLWMWILDENTIITCFPRRWGRDGQDASAVDRCIRTRLEAVGDNEIQSVFDLAIIIMDQCSRVFFDRNRSLVAQPDVLEAYAKTIGWVAHQQEIAEDYFWEFMRLTSAMYEQVEPDHDMAREMQKAMGIHAQEILIRDIKGIIKELYIMIHIKEQQRKMAQAFAKQLHRLSKLSQPKTPQDIRTTHSESIYTEPGKSRPPRHESSGGYDSRSYPHAGAEHLLENLQSHAEELSYLKTTAEDVFSSLRILLELKQQQSAIVEGRATTWQNFKQARSVMVFTVVTLIFLPLSFFTGFFGMNISEMSEGWPIREIVKVMAWRGEVINNAIRRGAKFENNVPQFGEDVSDV
ncbi:hypothetical protein DL95DRAFT_467167 [Leptodontidium sp. 2 PMI_412]|nr:hypothetical protein DL95DRAFT_467167 [Leptodontidium sp. 2 PMI_412]